ncbi:Outer membrane protein, beta-barrel [Metarhizium robertsii ARSEF 23]|uniref:Outer membrane protein, beta-barrel n=1 Tax=Metarhizium robertsii (strain ARSEF 23 / ATCC MYA-3075) TaxID=655844 RepID=E9EM60_METRA|nr:Outer membrane protein, beta-barrel [Metarhizium robertsii ARSEF 23]EFZ04488.2 Outer membrane protein, beta-barrel [Metarhizium robertsii ARSEF 23]
MATETETLSLPPTTAPTDFTSSALCPPPHINNSDQDCTMNEVHSVDWDTNMTTPCLMPESKVGAVPQPPQQFMMHPLGQPQQVEYNDDMSDSGSSNISSSIFSQQSVEESCRRALPHFPRPAISFPMPALEFDFRIAVALNPEPSRVENKVKKEITTVAAGQWSGSFGNGRVLAGGYDLGQARGFRPIRIVEGAFVMQTTDQPPAVLEMRTRGSLSGPCDILDSLLGPGQSKDIDPRQYGFRMFATVKTPDKRYAEIVNCGLWVASGMWSGEELIIEYVIHFLFS